MIVDDRSHFSVSRRALFFVTVAATASFAVASCSTGGADKTVGGASSSTQVSESVSTSASAQQSISDVAAAHLAKDSEQMISASNGLIAHANVSEETRALAEEAKGIFSQQADTLGGVANDLRDSGVSAVPTDVVDRIAAEGGSLADMAYLTLLEQQLPRLIDAWNGLKDSSNAQVSDLANRTVPQLEGLVEKVKQRLHI